MTITVMKVKTIEPLPSDGQPIINTVKAVKTNTVKCHDKIESEKVP